MDPESQSSIDTFDHKFGQMVIGPPGSGKTTYCIAMKTYFENYKRKTLLINLDPANESKNVHFDIDIRELINLDDVEHSLHLGPNSSFLYCFNFLEKNIDWLLNKIHSHKDIFYLIFDTPGQIEIFTLSSSFKNICKILTNEKESKIHLTCVNLVESINICDMPKYLFSVLSVLNAMINLALPQVNLISKADLIKSFKKDTDIPFDLDFFKTPSDCEQLNYYIDSTNVNPRFKNLNKKISEFISDYGLVSFSLFDISNVKHLNRAAYLADKGNGYLYSPYAKEDSEENMDSRMLIAKNDMENEDDADQEYEL